MGRRKRGKPNAANTLSMNEEETSQHMNLTRNIHFQNNSCHQLNLSWNPLGIKPGITRIEKGDTRSQRLFLHLILELSNMVAKSTGIVHSGEAMVILRGQQEESIENMGDKLSVN